LHELAAPAGDLQLSNGRRPCALEELGPNQSQRMATSDLILIVGGGLGGLTAALALAQRGRRSRVFEGAPEFGAIGYGIQFGPNVFHVFDRIGVSEEVKAAADTPPGLLMLDAFTAAEVTRVPTGEPSFQQRFRYPYIIIHRIDLHNVLLDACRRSEAIELVPDAQIVGYQERGDGVLLKTEDGRSFSGAAAIGADGLRSRVRAQMLDDGEPRPIGYVAHRTIVPMQSLNADVHREHVVLWAGPGHHIVHYPLRHGELFNIVAVFRTLNHARKGDAAFYRAEVEHAYRGAHPSMQALLAMMDLDRRWTIGDRDPIRRWHRGRVVLLGDAAHPTLQTFAQGACMAIEDGFYLAELIHLAGEDYEAAFRQFAAERNVRTARLTLESRSVWELYHAEGIARDVAQQVFAERTEDDTYRCLAWLYDGVPPPGVLRRR
jgi:salicylate hydroxylase